MSTHDLMTTSCTTRSARWARRAIAVTTAAVVAFGIGASAHGSDITPWKVCQAAEMPLAVDFGGIAAPNLVHDAQTAAALLSGTGDDPGCEIYDLPAGL